MTCFGALPTHKKHVLDPVDRITVTDAYSIRIKTALGPMLKKWLPVFENDFAFNNVNVDGTNRGTVICIPAAEKNPIDISLKLNRQRVGRMGEKLGVTAIT